jgi:hypothetical protein
MDLKILTPDEVRRQQKLFPHWAVPLSSLAVDPTVWVPPDDSSFQQEHRLMMPQQETIDLRKWAMELAARCFEDVPECASSDIVRYAAAFEAFVISGKSPSRAAPAPEAAA